MDDDIKLKEASSDKVAENKEEEKTPESAASSADVKSNDKATESTENKPENAASDKVGAGVPASAKSGMREKQEKPVPTVKNEGAVIEFKKVSKIYGKNIKAVDNVSFKIAPGEFISLVGPSGAGKSTLIKLLTCEEAPSNGQVLVSGRDIAKLQKKELPFYRRKVGIIFQDFKLLPKKTVYENVAFALEVADAKNSEIADRVPKIIEIVGLGSRTNAMSEELSGGEKQRVSIARALVHKPKLLIADEPTGNLDPVTTWEIIELLFKINNQGTIVLLATHDKEVVDALQRRVITMRDGKIISDQAKGKYIL